MKAASQVSVRPPETARVLVVSPDPADSSYLREILAGLDCKLMSASDSSSATKFLRDGGFHVVIAERNLPDGDWLDVLSSVQSLALAPPLIVVSRFADEHLWAEVLNRSGFDVLPKPFVRTEVCRVMEHALCAYSNMIPKPKRPASVTAEAHLRRASAALRAS
jgi:DNA-binding NtrC family response regulator